MKLKTVKTLHWSDEDVKEYRRLKILRTISIVCIILFGVAIYAISVYIDSNMLSEKQLNAKHVGIFFSALATAISATAAGSQHGNMKEIRNKY